MTGVTQPVPQDAGLESPDSSTASVRSTFAQNLYRRLTFGVRVRGSIVVVLAAYLLLVLLPRKMNAQSYPTIDPGSAGQVHESQFGPAITFPDNFQVHSSFPKYP